jgi:hypothetical protein
MLRDHFNPVFRSVGRVVANIKLLERDCVKGQVHVKDVPRRLADLRQGLIQERIDISRDVTDREAISVGVKSLLEDVTGAISRSFEKTESVLAKNPETPKDSLARQLEQLHLEVSQALGYIEVASQASIHRHLRFQGIPRVVDTLVNGRPPSPYAQ